MTAMHDWQVDSERYLLQSSLREAIIKLIQKADVDGEARCRDFVLTWAEWHGLMAEVQKGLTAEAYREFLLILNGLPVGIARDLFTKFTAENVRKNQRP